MINAARLFQLITPQTGGQNTIDLAFVTNEQIINNVINDSFTCLKSDHRAITFDVPIGMKMKNKPSKRCITTRTENSMDCARQYRTSETVRVKFSTGESRDRRNQRP